MHVHTLKLKIPTSTQVICDGCDVELRLATRDEAIFVQQTDSWAPDGPMVGPKNTVVVPAGFSLWPDSDPVVDEPVFPDDFDMQPDRKWLTRSDDDQGDWSPEGDAS